MRLVADAFPTRETAHAVNNKEDLSAGNKLLLAYSQAEPGVELVVGHDLEDLAQDSRNSSCPPV